MVAALRLGWSDARAEAEARDPHPLDVTRAPSLLGLQPDTVFGAAVRSAPGLSVIGSSEHQLGWLVERRTLAPPEEGTTYDAAYFEGDEAGVGYRGYLEQEPWRMEKARRFLGRVTAASELIGRDLPKKPTLLDVGAGYGFFRQAAEEQGWSHQGVEVSGHAADVGEHLFGFSAFVGNLEDFRRSSDDRFDVLTMWDVLEHVSDPMATLRCAWSLLREGGLLLIRTPNLEALERRVFGSSYHSFKAEHLYYFGPRSLLDALDSSGFGCGLLLTDSHLLRGFLGRRLERFERLLQGSDFFTVAVKSAAQAA
jgi:2-polyprenyl-3-methyl-5-hydroxy-6-metoxy-1,4-benzoquinol methylase